MAPPPGLYHPINHPRKGVFSLPKNPSRSCRATRATLYSSGVSVRGVRLVSCGAGSCRFKGLPFVWPLAGGRRSRPHRGRASALCARSFLVARLGGCRPGEALRCRPGGSGPLGGGASAGGRALRSGPFPRSCLRAARSALGAARLCRAVAADSGRGARPEFNRGG